jgi:hypothetical protein
MDEPQDQELQRQAGAKLPYHPPTMVDYGHIATLTQGDM